MRLDGKKALVTGAGSYGIGRAIALAFAREGADVAIHYHSRPDVAASVVADIEALGRASFSLQADLSEAEACRELVRAAAERLGGLDVIVTAAAAIYRKPILEITDDEWDHMMALNLRGTFACATEAARLMRANGAKGRIIVIGSIVQQLALAGQIAYGTTKAGVAQLARGMAYELAARRHHGQRDRAGCHAHRLQPRLPGRSGGAAKAHRRDPDRPPGRARGHGRGRRLPGQPRRRLHHRHHDLRRRRHHAAVMALSPAPISGRWHTAAKWESG